MANQFTFNVNLMSCVVAPDVAVTVTVYVPEAVPGTVIGDGFGVLPPPHELSAATISNAPNAPASRICRLPVRVITTRQAAPTNATANSIGHPLPEPGSDWNPPAACVV